MTRKITNLPHGLLTEVVESLVTGVSITDTSGTILYVNPAFQQITGYTSEEVIGENHSILSYMKTPARVYDDMWRTISSEKIWTGRLLNRRKNGKPYLADLKIAPLRGDDPSGESYYLGIQRDVSAEMGLERHVAAQKALIENIVDVAPVVITLLSEHGKVLIDNHAYKVLMADMGGQEPAWAFLEAISDGAASQFLLDQRECHNTEVKLEVGRLGSRWFSCSGLWIDTAHANVDSFYEAMPRRALLLVCLDVTPRMRAFQQAKSSAIRATTAETQQALGMREALQGAVFQLQGPLNMLAAATSMMERNGDINPALAQPLSEVQTAGREALAHLSDSLPQNISEPVLPLNINELVREVMDFMIQRILAEGGTISWTPALVLPAIQGRAGQLRTLLKVLIDNAIDAVSEPGSQERNIKIETRRGTDGCVEIVVSDSGPGVKQTDKIRMFEPFFTGWKRWNRRPGMGLAIAQNILTEHGGTIDVQTVPEGGCRIVVGLPVGDEALITRGDGI